MTSTTAGEDDFLRCARHNIYAYKYYVIHQLIKD